MTERMFILLASFPNYIDANIALGRLQEEGIQCWLRDEHTVTIDPILTQAVGGIKLMVHEAQAERAAALMEGYLQERRAQHPCPQCGSTHTELVTSPRSPATWITALASFFAGDYALPAGKVMRCFDCHHEWKPE